MSVTVFLILPLKGLGLGASEQCLSKKRALARTKRMNYSGPRKQAARGLGLRSRTPVRMPKVLGSIPSTKIKQAHWTVFLILLVLSGITCYGMTHEEGR